MSKYLHRLIAHSFGEFKNCVASWYYVIPLNTAEALCPVPQTLYVKSDLSSDSTCMCTDNSPFRCSFVGLLEKNKISVE